MPLDGHQVADQRPLRSLGGHVLPGDGELTILNGELTILDHHEMVDHGGEDVVKGDGTRGRGREQRVVQGRGTGELAVTPFSGELQDVALVEDGDGVIDSWLAFLFVTASTVSCMRPGPTPGRLCVWWTCLLLIPPPALSLLPLQDRFELGKPDPRGVLGIAGERRSQSSSPAGGTRPLRGDTEDFGQNERGKRCDLHSVLLV